jgi:hypothetical protein
MEYYAVYCASTLPTFDISNAPQRFGIIIYLDCLQGICKELNSYLSKILTTELKVSQIVVAYQKAEFISLSW